MCVCVCVCGFVGGGAAQRPISGGGEETERLLAVKSASETPTPRLQEARLEITLRVVVRLAQQTERLLGVISTRVHH